MLTSPVLLIIRGIPGSGKTTLAKKYAETENVDHWEADMFFTDSLGEYTYDHRYIKDAHAWCLSNVQSSLMAGRNTIVSNTFIKIWEVKPYLALGYPVKIIEMDPICHRQTHNVPEATIKRMKDSFESLLR